MPKLKRGVFLEIKLKNNDVFRGSFFGEENGNLILKLENGYNVGFEKKNIRKIKTIKKIRAVKKRPSGKKIKAPDFRVLLLLTGGTIASKVEYETGAVRPGLSKEEILELIPEIGNIANIDVQEVSDILSENIDGKTWRKIGNSVFKALKNKKYDAVVVGHGTDVMHYTGSLLSFMIDGINKPIIFTGSQRSSDRPSSDSRINLISSILFAREKIPGVFICMHGSVEDKTNVVINAVNARKMHTSRRDAFKSLNQKEIAIVSYKERIVEIKNRELISFLREKFSNEKLRLNNFEERVFLLRFFPNMDENVFNFLKKKKGAVLEGSGLGHVSDKVIGKIKSLARKTPTYMTSQCLYGRTNLNVYQTGRKLQEIGVLGLEDMLPETALMKLMVGLKKFRKKIELDNYMTTNQRGEISRTSKVV